MIISLQRYNKNSIRRPSALIFYLSFTKKGNSQPHPCLNSNGVKPVRRRKYFEKKEGLAK